MRYTLIHIYSPTPADILMLILIRTHTLTHTYYSQNIFTDGYYDEAGDEAIKPVFSDEDNVGLFNKLCYSLLFSCIQS